MYIYYFNFIYVSCEGKKKPIGRETYRRAKTYITLEKNKFKITIKELFGYKSYDIHKNLLILNIIINIIINR